jgi:hypothetical protein
MLKRNIIQIVSSSLRPKVKKSCIEKYIKFLIQKIAFAF